MEEDGDEVRMMKSCSQLFSQTPEWKCNSMHAHKELLLNQRQMNHPSTLSFIVTITIIIIIMFIHLVFHRISNGSKHAHLTRPNRDNARSGEEQGITTISPDFSFAILIVPFILWNPVAQRADVCCASLGSWTSRTNLWIFDQSTVETFNQYWGGGSNYFLMWWFKTAFTLVNQ